MTGTPTEPLRPLELVIELLSATTPGTGVGVAGLVDIDVDHDELGLPRLGVKAVRSLLRDTWLSMSPHFTQLAGAAPRIFGPEGDTADTGILRVGVATVDPEVRPWVAAALHRDTSHLTAEHILQACTDVRHRTAEARSTGAPQSTTLRAVRVLPPSVLLLHAPLTWLDTPNDDDVRCLALAALGTRHLGSQRTRGLGHVRCTLDGDLDRTRAHARGRAEEDAA